ncbi:MAG: ATP-dependent helicase HrpB, partial [Actinomycetota bacterium]|nr:ATP-dependent helicase HrpB [Actinomycetota bacterium]
MLPVEECLPRLREALADDGQAVLVAPPGAGKTTVVPLRLLDEPWLAGQRIVVLEPRRLATRAAARRMAWLLGEEVGATVGYTTRDERRVGRGTRIEVVTEGVLTRRLQADPSLPGVGLVAFDELHERNLQAELALALVLDARPALRPDLRLLAMSATLEAAKVASLLGGAPVIESEGRAHPVDVRWLPRKPKDRIDAATTAAVQRAVREEPGDVLVFLPGAADIRRVESALTLPPDVDVRPLFGALPVGDQDAALAPSPAGRRRVVLATDIAETSLTVEGVRVVVDSGEARSPRFDARSGLTKLRTGPISRASAEQRAGRAGRTEPGVAYRLWSKLEHAARRAHPDPEIATVDLAGLALELAVWGADPADLAFLDPPPSRALEEGRRLLTFLGALDAEGRRPTAAGRQMAELPLHPRLARMVVGAAEAETPGGGPT